MYLVLRICTEYRPDYDEDRETTLSELGKIRVAERRENGAGVPGNCLAGAGTSRFRGSTERIERVRVFRLILRISFVLLRTNLITDTNFDF